MDRAACEFNVISDNCLENQILKVALERCAKLISEAPLLSGLEVVHQWIRNARMVLAGVEVKKITLSAFQGIWYGGTFQHYRQPHAYARMVFSSIGLDPDATGPIIDGRPKALPPFALCTSELFERFCEVGLRNSGVTVEAGYGFGHDRELGDAFAIRPDFLVRRDRKAWIADAKYKPQWASQDIRSGVSARGSLRDDVFQVITYSRHSHVLESLGGLTPEVLILYPAAVPTESWRATSHWFGSHGPSTACRILPGDFLDPVLYRVPVPVPSLPSDDWVAAMNGQ